MEKDRTAESSLAIGGQRDALVWKWPSDPFSIFSLIFYKGGLFFSIGLWEAAVFDQLGVKMVMIGGTHEHTRTCSPLLKCFVALHSLSFSHKWCHRMGRHIGPLSCEKLGNEEFLSQPQWAWSAVQSCLTRLDATSRLLFSPRHSPHTACWFWLI